MDLGLNNLQRLICYKNPTNQPSIQISMEQENQLAGHKKLSLQFQRRIVHEVKKKTLSTSKILKSLVDAPCSTRTIRKYLNEEKIKHKKRIHHPSLKRNDWNMLVNIKP